MKTAGGNMYFHNEINEPDDIFPNYDNTLALKPTEIENYWLLQSLRNV